VSQKRPFKRQFKLSGYTAVFYVRTGSALRDDLSNHQGIASQESAKLTLADLLLLEGLDG
jgi:hypothetical protein